MRVVFLSLGLLLAGCDDTQDTCRQVVVKYQQCEDKIIEDKLKGLPDAFKDAALQVTKEKVKETNAAAVNDMKQQCESGKFSTNEKKVFRYWKQCLKKDCTEFLDCITSVDKK